MADTINEYRQLIDKPYGKMFYDMIFRQLDLSERIPLKILDFGAGFCVTAKHYSKYHTVTAIEPNREMIDLSIQDNRFELIHGGLEVLGRYEDNSFDVVICHNVLEYVPDKESILQELVRVLKQGGTLSIVKHNLLGRVMSYAVFFDNPKDALNLLSDGDRKSNMFGKRDTYEDEYLMELGNKYGLVLENRYGIRTFFSLSQNDEIKFTQEWYYDMLELEMKACNLESFKSVSFFHHLIFQKKYKT